MSVIPTVTSTVQATVSPTAAPGGGFGPNIVTNGTFDSDLTGWTAAANWSWDASKSVIYNGNPGGVERALSQTLTTEIGAVYRVKLQTGFFAAQPLRVDVGGVTVITDKTTSGWYTGDFTGTGSDLLEIIVDSSSVNLVAVDNVTARQIS